MSVEVLISTMNVISKEQHKKLLEKMNIKNKSLTINQCIQENIKKFDIENANNRVFSFSEKGLSKSRNKALERCKSSIGLIADDDLEYVNDYEKIIESAYERYKDADVIAFYVENAKNKNANKEGQLRFLNTFKVCSVQISFKVESIIKNKIIFDECFGAGSDIFINGEENIFLADCLKKGLKIYYCPVKIAVLHERESSWFAGYNEKFFQSTGAKFYRMSKYLNKILILQYAIRKRQLYCNDIYFMQAIKYMLEGANIEKHIKGELK